MPSKTIEIILKSLTLNVDRCSNLAQRMFRYAEKERKDEPLNEGKYRQHIQAHLSILKAKKHLADAYKRLNNLDSDLKPGQHLSPAKIDSNTYNDDDTRKENSNVSKNNSNSV